MPSWSRGQVLGRGSTATVSLAFDSFSGESFAVKSTNLSCSEYLQREQRIHSSFASSPYVISYLGFDVDDECYNLFLEYASGGSLSDVIRKQKLKEIDIRSYARDVLLGLSHLHSMKIAHCDIKSQNILIGHDGKAKVADLGCAKHVDGDRVNKGKIMGTPMFMAPEVARGEEQGLAADVWALGCTVIEMATSRAPWTNVSDAGSLLYRVGFTDDVPELPEWISDEGKDFLGKCFIKEAKDRSSVDELLMHPFVSNLDLNSNWISPKSTLDNSFWDSLLSEDEDEGKNELKSNPIEDLISFGNGPNWSWDDSWHTVRINDQTVGDESISRPAESTSEINTAATVVNSSTFSAVISEEFMFGTNHIGTGDFDPESCAFSHVPSDKCERDILVGSRNCSSGFVTLLTLANKLLFDLIRVVTLQSVVLSITQC